jgi:hypothetical protein
MVDPKTEEHGVLQALLCNVADVLGEYLRRQDQRACLLRLDAQLPDDADAFLTTQLALCSALEPLSEEQLCADSVRWKLKAATAALTTATLCFPTCRYVRIAEKVHGGSNSLPPKKTTEEDAVLGSSVRHVGNEAWEVWTWDGGGRSPSEECEALLQTSDGLAFASTGNLQIDLKLLVTSRTVVSQDDEEVLSTILKTLAAWYEQLG